VRIVIDPAMIVKNQFGRDEHRIELLEEDLGQVALYVPPVFELQRGGLPVPSVEAGSWRRYELGVYTDEARATYHLRGPTMGPRQLAWVRINLFRESYPDAQGVEVQGLVGTLHTAGGVVRVFVAKPVSPPSWHPRAPSAATRFERDGVL
jgi:hypothetical protein